MYNNGCFLRRTNSLLFSALCEPNESGWPRVWSMSRQVVYPTQPEGRREHDAKQGGLHILVVAISVALFPNDGATYARDGAPYIPGEYTDNNPTEFVAVLCIYVLK